MLVWGGDIIPVGNILVAADKLAPPEDTTRVTTSWELES